MSDGGFSPDVGQVIAADGKISYNFDGHVHAKGLDLDANNFGPNDNTIRWVRSDGGVIAQIEGFETGAGHLNLLTGRVGGSLSTGFGLFAGDVSPSQIAAYVPGRSVMVLDENNKSSYVKAGLGDVLNTADHRIFGPYGVALNIPVGGTQSATINSPAFDAPGGWVISGYFNQVAGAWLNLATWAVYNNGAGFAQISFYLSAAAGAPGTGSFFCVVHAYY